MTPTPEQQSREIFFAGIGHFEAGRLDEARDCFERCRALTPERPSVVRAAARLRHRGRCTCLWVRLSSESARLGAAL